MKEGAGNVIHQNADTTCRDMRSRAYGRQGDRDKALHTETCMHCLKAYQKKFEMPIFSWWTKSSSTKLCSSRSKKHAA
jgi:hypothetical protein